MNLSEFPQLNNEVFSVNIIKLIDAKTILVRNAEVTLWRDSGKNWLRQGDYLVQVQPLQSAVQFNQALHQRNALWLLLSDKAGLLRLQCAQPSECLPLDEKLEICIDDAIVNQLYKAAQIEKPLIALALTWCRHEFLLEGESKRMAVVRYAGEQAANMQVIGRNWRADIKHNTEGKTQVFRLARQRQQVDAWNLFSGDIDFADFTVAAQLLSPAQQMLMQQSIQSNGSYLDLWEKYSQHEWERSLQQAAKLGAFRYTKCEPLNDEDGAWRFHGERDEMREFEQHWQQLESDQSLVLEAGEAMPVWSDSRYTDLTRADNTKHFRGRARFERDTIIIEVPRSVPPDRGALYLSLAGDRTVQERRKRARENIESGQRLPQLHRILQQVPVPMPRTMPHPALTPYAKACFKYGAATTRQEAAIKLALNTPDIALIIGPPGTGKTQVIAALERRLSELAESDTTQHQVLISSFQHDAVENALDRTSVYGLPALKIGGKRQQDGIDPFERWRLQQHEKVRDILAEHTRAQPHVPLLQSLSQQLAILRHARLDERERRHALEIVDTLLTQLTDTQHLRLSSSILGDWREYLDELPAPKPVGNQSGKVAGAQLAKGGPSALHAVRALRVTQCSFADDGPDRAGDALRILRYGGASVLQTDLEQLGELMVLADGCLLSSELMEQLAPLRDRLIDALLPDYRPPLVKHRLDSAGLQLIGRLEDVINDKLKQSRLGVAGVLSRYRDSFVNHPERARMAVREYAMIVGATCQQAASKAMANLKQLSGIGDAGITFDTVIVDEAARASPLDLFIPMSMASKRIVLVGDHRQLPHLLEPLVEEDVSKQHNLNEQQRQAYRESLFERLWRQLHDQERVVMLDTQFRMHPVMGAFVSRHFYEAVGLDKLKHGRAPDEFLLDVPGFEGKVCAWLNVPQHQGQERKADNSRVRQPEAVLVAQEAKRLLATCAAEVSIGIITFYSAQRDAIFEALASSGITTRDAETRQWQIAEPYRKTPDGNERLRIGTVDAFQGKEFDIVLLSVVRSNKFKLPATDPQGENFDKAANQKYGHLRLNNRLNVAMSRQRSLLIAIGDDAMVRGSAAELAAPILAAFYQLCGGEHGLVR